MEKRLPRKSPQLPEKYPSGCRWGFMRFFDLFHGHSSRKLISNASHFDWHKKGHDSVSGRPKLLPASDKKYQVSSFQDERTNPSVDPRYASVCNPRRGHKQFFSSSPGYYSKKNGKMDQIHEYSTHHRKSAEGCRKFYRADSAGRVSNSTFTGLFSGYGCRNIGCVNNGVTGTKVRSAYVAGTAESVVSQKLIDQTTHNSKELLETLDILNSNKELFMRLLEDRNSLLARQIEDLLCSQGKRLRTELSLRQHEGNGLSYGAQKENKQILSLQRFKSEENSVLKRNCCTNQCNGIVILKPRSDFSVRNKLKTVQQSHFPLRRFRRKLRWMQQRKCMSLNVEVRADSAHKASSKSTADLSFNRDSENRKDQLVKLSNGRDGIKKSSEEKFQRNSWMSFSTPSDQVKVDGELRLLGETKRSILSSLKLNADSVSSHCDKSDDQSNCLDTSINLVLSTETRETETALALMSSEGSTEINSLQEEPSSSPREVQEDEDPVTCIEDHVDQSEYIQTDFMRCPLGSRMIVDEPNHDLRSASDYVKAAMVAADLDWDKLLVNFHVSDKILQPSLFDEVKIPFDGSGINQQLLFDYINEVLGEVHHCHQMRFRTFALEKNATHAVMKRVHRDQDLFLQGGSPTLEQLVSKDMTYFTKWIDIPSSTEEIVTELVEDILEDSFIEI